MESISIEVLGADGTIKTSGASAKEQRARLKRKGVTFRVGRADLDAFYFAPILPNEM